MTLSIQNLSVVIVSFYSEDVIHDCIKSIPNEIKIIVVDNSGDKLFKENIEKKYNNVECILSSENLGMGPGNNLGLRYVKTDYAFILNPDVILKKNTIDEIISESNKIQHFSIIAPISNKEDYPNYQLDDLKHLTKHTLNPFKVKSVDGYAMIINLKRLNELESFKSNNFFDENIFLYLENDDLCKRIIDNNENIYVVPSSKITHLGASAVDKKYNQQVELSRNWHWIWSKFYYNKKHNGFFSALTNCLPTFISALIKYFFYLITMNSKKKKIYLHRCLGFINALLGKKSYFRPRIVD